MPDEPTSHEKKIIVDEDWKSQVEAEREAARQAEGRQEAPAGAGPSPAPGPLPPPDLTLLASTLYLQAMVALGVLPNPMSNKPQVQLEQAKHAIDTLQVLFDKTSGNRTPEETEAIDTMLHETRMAYVTVEERGMKKEE